MILYQNSVLNMWNIWYAIHIFRHQNTLLMMPILNARQLSLLYVWLNFACSYRWDLKPQNSYYQISIVCKIIKIHFHLFFRCKILSIDFFLWKLKANLRSVASRGICESYPRWCICNYIFLKILRFFKNL